MSDEEKAISSFNEKRAFQLLCTQAGFGPRYPGSPGQHLLIEFIKSEFGKYAHESSTQPFEVTLHKKTVACENVLGRIKGVNPVRSVLLGTHFDTRPIADRDKEPGLRKKPILGANDGGSGTAVMLEIARVLFSSPPPCDVIFAFFDAEDVGSLDGNHFYRGSHFFSQNMGGYVPDEAIILDMVGGKDMCLDVDLNCLYFDTLYGLGIKAMMLKIFTIARRFSYEQFYKNKKNKFKYIECDHIPFLRARIPSFILIDIDYPQWHTHRDLPEFCSQASLKATGDVVLEYLYCCNKKIEPARAEVVKFRPECREEAESFSPPSGEEDLEVKEKPAL